MRAWSKRIRADRRFRWFAVATLFTALGLALLKLFVDGLHWHYALSTLVQSEICNLLRFLVNDRWVFGYPRPTWKRLVQYHVANAMSFALWWGAANALKALGMNYLLASVFAMVAGFSVSWFTNFRWIWRKRHEPEPATREPATEAGTH